MRINPYGISTNTSLYVSGVATFNSDVTISSYMIGNGSALTNLNYNAISNKPNLTIYPTQSYVDDIFNSVSGVASISSSNASTCSSLSILCYSYSSTCSNLSVLCSSYASTCSNLSVLCSTSESNANNYKNQASTAKDEANVAMGLAGSSAVGAAASAVLCAQYVGECVAAAELAALNAIGLPGPSGPPGPQGSQGIQGIQADTGPQRPIGPQFTTCSTPLLYTTTMSTLSIDLSALNNKTSFNQLYVSENSTFQGYIIGNGSALTNLNWSAVSNPPVIPNLNNPITCLSTLFVSGTSIFNNPSTCSSTLNVVGNITGSGASVFLLNSNINSFSTAGPLSINNINATSTTLFNKTNFTAWFVTGNSIISSNSTFSSALNVVSNLIASGMNLFSLNLTSTTTLNNLNSFSTAAQLSINNINATSTSLFNKTKAWLPPKLSSISECSKLGLLQIKKRILNPSRRADASTACGGEALRASVMLQRRVVAVRFGRRCGSAQSGWPRAMRSPGTA